MIDLTGPMRRRRFGAVTAPPATGEFKEPPGPTPDTARSHQGEVGSKKTQARIKDLQPKWMDSPVKDFNSLGETDLVFTKGHPNKVI